MSSKRKAYFVGGGIGSLAGAAFLIRDGGMPGANIQVFDAGPVMGCSLGGAGVADRGHTMRSGAMLTADSNECTWNLFKSIPSIVQPGLSVFDETLDFNKAHVANAMARLVNCQRAKVPVASMGFSMHDRVELLKLANANESTLGASCITEHLSPAFFQTGFWFMWATTFAFQPWHSAVEFRRHLHRFMRAFSSIETLACIQRTVLNPHDALVVPLQRWLQAQGVRLTPECTVTDIDARDESGCFEILSLTYVGQDVGKQVGEQVGKDRPKTVLAVRGDLVFVQNGSMTDASSLGSMTTAPAKLNKALNGSWAIWEQLAKGRPSFGNPAAFNQCVAQSDWTSFTVTLKDPTFFDQMQRFSGNEAGTGALVTFKDSNWLMSIELPHQPQFANQPADVQVFWGYGLCPDRMPQNTTINRRIVLNARPPGAPTATDFCMQNDPVPKSAAGQVLLRTLYLSLDPYMRGRMSDGPSYAAPVALGAVMVGSTVSRVEDSRHGDFKVGLGLENAPVAFMGSVAR